VLKTLRNKLQILLFGDLEEDGDERPRKSPPRNSSPRRADARIRREQAAMQYRDLFTFGPSGETVATASAASEPLAGKKRRRYKPIGSVLYEMRAEKVDELYGDNHPEVLAIQEQIRVRSAEVRAAWSPQHRAKACQYKVRGIVFSPIASGLNSRDEM